MDTDLKVWRDHFEYHAGRRSALPQATQNDLTAYERRLVAKSLATFQLGEQSEGRSLLSAAQRHEEKHGADGLSQIVTLLIAEEQHHAALIGTFMDQHGLPRKRLDWTDSVFRRVRRLAGFETHITVLITAELIGKVYYRALEAATGCRQLQALCRMLVADELAHVGFESDLLRAMQAKRAPLGRFASSLLHKVFFTGTAAVVWLTHWRVLRAAGYRMPMFLRACAAQYSFYLEPSSHLNTRPYVSG